MIGAGVINQFTQVTVYQGALDAIEPFFCKAFKAMGGDVEFTFLENEQGDDLAGLAPGGVIILKENDLLFGNFRRARVSSLSAGYLIMYSF